MKLKIGRTGAVTPAHPGAPLGKTPTGAWIVEVANVPAGTTAAEVVHRYSYTAILGQLERVDWSQLGYGCILKTPAGAATDG